VNVEDVIINSIDLFEVANSLQIIFSPQVFFKLLSSFAIVFGIVCFFHNACLNGG
jgi:hypothetical protein